MDKQCEYIKKDGTRCGGYAVTDSDLCINHDPEMKEIKMAAVKKGGSAETYQTLGLQLPPIEVVTASDVVPVIIQLINELRNGEIPSRIATTVGYLLGIALKALEVSDVERRIETFERVILERGKRS